MTARTVADVHRDFAAQFRTLAQDLQNEVNIALRNEKIAMLRFDINLEVLERTEVGTGVVGVMVVDASLGMSIAYGNGPAPPGKE